MSTRKRNHTSTKAQSRTTTTRQKTSQVASRLTVLEKRKDPQNSKQRFGLLCQAAVDLLSPDELMQVSDSVQRELQRLGHLREAGAARGQLLQAVQDQLESVGFPKRQADQNRILRDVLAESFQQRQALLADALS